MQDRHTVTLTYKKTHAKFGLELSSLIFDYLDISDEGHRAKITCIFVKFPGELQVSWYLYIWSSWVTEGYIYGGG